VYLVTALVPSLTACLANSPGNKIRATVWISQLVMVFGSIKRSIYFDEVYLVTALVPTPTACLANSPGNKRQSTVGISRLVMVERLF
jgi:hypothetical protein